VCRTFGDAEAKLGTNGNSNVVIAVPEIRSFKIENNHDFIIMGSDGIFDKLSNKEVVQCAWNSVRQEKMEKVHQQCGVAVDTVIKNALFRKSLDNVTAVIVAFGNYKRLLKAENENKENQSKLSNILRPDTTKVLSKIVATSTKMAEQKHFNFSNLLEKTKKMSHIY